MKVFSFTGHRPNKLGGYGDTAREKLIAFAEVKLYELKPDHCISGMALGWDTAIAQACVNLRIPFTAAVPFPNQYSVWNKPDQERWHNLTKQAHSIVLVSESYSKENLQKRNEWMVDNSDCLVALHNGTKGGTYNCIEYAKRANKSILNWYNDYKEFITPSIQTTLFS